MFDGDWVVDLQCFQSDPSYRSIYFLLITSNEQQNASGIAEEAWNWIACASDLFAQRKASRRSGKCSKCSNEIPNNCSSIAQGNSQIDVCHWHNAGDVILFVSVGIHKLDAVLRKFLILVVLKWSFAFFLAVFGVCNSWKDSKMTGPLTGKALAAARRRMAYARRFNSLVGGKRKRKCGCPKKKGTKKKKHAKRSGIPYWLM